MNRYFVFLGLNIWAFLYLSCYPSKMVSPTKTDGNFKLSSRLEVLNLKEISGEPLFIKDYLGKPIFINFWATWCGPCKLEMESLNSVVKDFGKDIQFIFVSNESPSKIEEFAKSHNYPFHYIKMEGEFIDAYITQLPTTLLINKDGEVFEEEEGLRLWNQASSLNKLKSLISD